MAARPEHLSYSSLTSWERCKKKWALEKLVNAPGKPAWYFAGGTAVHRLTEESDLDKRVEPLEGEALAKAWRTTFYPEVKSLMEANGGIYGDTTKWLSAGSQDNPERGDAWDLNGPPCVTSWQRFVKEEIEKIDHVELDVSTSLPGVPVPVKGFVDRVVIHKDHGPMIIDIKTGKSRPSGSFQLKTYYVLMQERFGGAPLKGAYFMARAGKLTRPVEMTIQDTAEVVQRFAAMASEASEAITFSADQQFSCRFCTQQDNCVEFAGPTARARYFEEKLNDVR